MIALVLALAIASPPLERQCAQTCSDLGTYHRCYVTPRRACLKREWECVDGPRVDCVPLSVNLGAWSPVWNDAPRATIEPEDWPAVTPPVVPYELP